MTILERLRILACRKLSLTRNEDHAASLERVYAQLELERTLYKDAIARRVHKCGCTTNYGLVRVSVTVSTGTIQSEIGRESLLNEVKDQVRKAAKWT
jgi:hypothetical protein